MKIILRDIFHEFFPKYSHLYESLSAEQKQSIISTNNKPTQVQQQIIPNHAINLTIPQNLGPRRSSTTSKQKNGQLTLQRNKSKEESIKMRCVNDKLNEDAIQKGMTFEDNQRLKQILPDKLLVQITQFINCHRFHTPSLPVDTVISHLTSFLLHCLTHTPSFQSKPRPHPTLSQNLYKLSLYLNKDTNKQIFTVYEHILLANSRTGISYQTLAKKLKTDIINVSHYCCKLKKMRFVEWEHRKYGVVVFPMVVVGWVGGKKEGSMEIIRVDGQESFSYANSFLFDELSLNENILVNLCSSNSLLQGGLTNEQIKFKIMKHAENKMVRRTVEGMKHIERNAERQGKVFEFKYKKQTMKVIQQMDKKRGDSINHLTDQCRVYINSTFGQEYNNELQNEELLQQIINTKLTDYYSSIGIKQSKRQCTPLKLNRYICILNELEQGGPATELELRRQIIEMEKQLETYPGVIHKRSVVGILAGLKKVGLVEDKEGWLYPVWCEVVRRERVEDGEEGEEGGAGRKKLKLDKQSRPKRFELPQQKIRMITKRQHLTEIFTELLSLAFQKAITRVLRKGFHRILYVHRKKEPIATFVSERNILYLLDEDDKQMTDRHPALQQHAATLESFMSSVQLFVSAQGRRLESFPQIEYEFVRYVRRHPSKHADSLRSKYGKCWQEKFEPLQREGVISISEHGYETVQRFDQFLV